MKRDEKVLDRMFSYIVQVLGANSHQGDKAEFEFIRFASCQRCNHYRRMPHMLLCHPCYNVVFKKELNPQPPEQGA